MRVRPRLPGAAGARSRLVNSADSLIQDEAPRQRRSGLLARFGDDSFVCVKSNAVPFSAAVRGRPSALAAAVGLLCGSVPHGETRVLKNFTLIEGTGRPPASASAIIMDNGRIAWV